jgi:hypothetical protein
MTLFGNVCVRRENYWFLVAKVRRQKIMPYSSPTSRQGSSLTAVLIAFGPLFLLAQEVSFGGTQRRVERQPQLRVEMQQGNKLPLLGFVFHGSRHPTTRWMTRKLQIAPIRRVALRPVPDRKATAPIITSETKSTFFLRPAGRI